MISNIYMYLSFTQVNVPLDKAGDPPDPTIHLNPWFRIWMKPSRLDSYHPYYQSTN